MISVSPSELPLVAVAAVMVSLNLAVLLQFFPRGRGPATVARATLAAFYLAASPIFWVAAIPAVLAPDLGSWDLVIWGMGIMMATPFVYLLTMVTPFGARPVRRDSWLWPLLLGVGILGNELLMGTVFTLATGAYAGPLDGSAGMLVSGFVQSVDSVWFFWSMLANMVVFLLWVPLPWTERGPLLALAATAFIAPFVSSAPLAASVGMAGVMTAAFVLLFEQLSRLPAITRAHQWTVLGVSAAFVGMSGTQFALYLAPASDGAALPFAAFSFGMMLVELVLLVRYGLAGVGTAVPTERWVSKPSSLTAFLAAAFIGEWLMSAAILAAVNGPSMFSLSVAPGGGGWATVGETVASGVMVVGSVTASPVFLGLMGIEMGALILPRLRRTPSPEQRTRLLLAVACYASYTVLAPVFVPTWSRIPGTWPNVGAFGPVGGGLALAMLGSYAVIGVLALSFGRRAYCSTLCPSAVMYGGEFSQRLIPTIQSSPVARRNVLSTMWRRIPTALGTSSWVVLGVVTGFSAWNASGGHDLSVASTDLAVFYSLAIWNVLWYGFFIAIPYLGMSPCRTWGFCSTGTFLGVLSRFGRYRKETLEIDVCRACPTRDCGKACEVGLADLPVVLARTGVFRASKCVGAHDCIEACPYGNLVARDIRDDLRLALRMPDRYRDRRPTHPTPATEVPRPLAGSPRVAVASWNSDPAVSP